MPWCWPPPTRVTSSARRPSSCLPTGTTKVVTTEKDYSNDIADNTIVTYKVDSDNVYTLKEVSSKQDKGGYNKTVKETDISNFVLKNDKASLNVDGTP